MQNSTDYRVSVQGDLIVAHTPYILKDACKGIAGARWNPELKCWTWDATAINAHAVMNGLPPRITRDESVKELAAQFTSAAKHNAEIKHAEDLPDIPGTKLSAWMHQRQAFWFAKDKPAVMLAMDMGTGKSKVTIDLLQNNGAKRVLIVCPKSVVSVWPSEFKKHCNIPHVVMPLNRYSVGKRADEMQWAMTRTDLRDDPMLVFVINYDAVWRPEIAKVIRSHNWDYIVCDESHRIKAPNGVASKFMGSIADKATRRLALTGTPLPHSPMDAYAQYRFLDKDVFGSSNTVFKQSYGIYGGYGGHELVGYKNQDQFNARFYSIAYRVGKEVLDLPEYNHVERLFTLEGKGQRVYSEIASDFMSWINEGQEVTVANALVKLLRLQQVTGGAIKADDGSLLEIHNQKGELLGELLGDIDESEPVVVFARFRADIDRIHVIAQKAGRKHYELSGKANDLQEWQESTGGDVLVVQMQSGGVGIDLTRARYCVYYSLGFSLGEYDQSLARTHRPGQTRPVTYFHLIAEGTIDRKVYNALQEKRDVVESILEELRY